jgi:hypothetical protein
MAEDSDLEKTEEPTGRRIEQAREQGQVPHSRELGTFLVLDYRRCGNYLDDGCLDCSAHNRVDPQRFHRGVKIYA